jgi:hypothetical protein
MAGEHLTYKSHYQINFRHHQIHILQMVREVKQEVRTEIIGVKQTGATKIMKHLSGLLAVTPLH